MSNAEGEFWGFTYAPDPREGWRETLRFVAEGVLAIGIMIRLVTHLLISSLEHPEATAKEVSTGLTLGFMVRKPASTPENQIAGGAIASGVIGCAGLFKFTAVSWALPPALVAIAIANWLYAAGDVAWLAIDLYRGEINGN